MTKEEIAKLYVPCRCDDIYTSRGLTAPDCPYHSTDPESAMDQFAKQQATAFFKWNCKQVDHYLNYLKRVHEADCTQEKDQELDCFENATIEQRYMLFISTNKESRLESQDVN